MLKGPQIFSMMHVARKSIATAVAGMGSIALNDAGLEDLTARLQNIEQVRHGMKKQLIMISSRLDAAESDLEIGTSSWACNKARQCELVAVQAIAVATEVAVVVEQEVAEEVAIEQLESVAGYSCSVCGCSVLYLDAAIGQLRCVKCDTFRGQNANPTLEIHEGKAGRNILGSGAWVDYSDDLFNDPDEIYNQLLEEVDFRQHTDRLDDGKIVTQPRLIAYQAEDPAVERYIYDYPGISEPLVSAPSKT
jgi:hypothetical protein